MGRGVEKGVEVERGREGGKGGGEEEAGAGARANPYFLMAQASSLSGSLLSEITLLQKGVYFSLHQQLGPPFPHRLQVCIC